MTKREGEREIKTERGRKRTYRVQEWNLHAYIMAVLMMGLVDFFRNFSECTIYEIFAMRVLVCSVVSVGVSWKLQGARKILALETYRLRAGLFRNGEISFREMWVRYHLLRRWHLTSASEKMMQLTQWKSTNMRHRGSLFIHEIP